MSKKNLYIYGSGGNGCELMDTARLVNETENKWKSIRFVDDIRTDSHWYGAEVYSFEKMVEDIDMDGCVISLGEPSYRKALRKRLLGSGVRLVSLIHPKANISKSANIGEGVVISFSSFVSSNTTLQDNVMIGINTVIGHDIEVGIDSIVSSGVVIGGGTKVGATSFLGINSTVKEQSSIGENVIVGMASAVFRNVDNDLIVMGSPARPMKKNQGDKVFG